MPEIGRIETNECTYSVSCRELGRGTFGTVVLATRIERDGRFKDVAIKFGRRGYEHDMHEEFGLLRQAAHPHVSEALAFVSEADVRTSTSDRIRAYGPALVCPAADTDLGMFIRRHGALHPTLSQAWGADVVEALAHLHAKGILHRDIKPSNLLIYFNGKAARAGGFVRSAIKIADFGRARFMPAPSRVTGQRIRAKQACDPWRRRLQDELPAMTARVATAWYRAPELLGATMTPTSLDAVSATERCGYGAPIDVWSYGAVLWEMLEGRPLVFAATGSGVMQCLERALGPCPDAGPRAPAFATTEAWRTLVRHMPERPDRMVWPSTEPWQVAKACLQWLPSDRATMANVRAMPWFSVAADQAHAPAPGTQGISPDRCASTPAGPTAGALWGGGQSSRAEGGAVENQVRVLRTLPRRQAPPGWRMPLEDVGRRHGVLPAVRL